MKISKSKQELARIISENGGWRNGAEWAAQDACGTLNSYQCKPVYSSGCVGFGHGGGYFHKICATAKIKNWHQTILSREEYFHLYPAPDADGWIEWNGGECPVERGTFVDIKDADGKEWLAVKASPQDEYSDAANVFWEWNCTERNKIVAYRLHKPEQAKPELRRSVVQPITEPEIQSEIMGVDQVNDINVVESKPTIEQLAADYRNKMDFANRKQQEADDAKAAADAALGELVAAGEGLGLVIGIAKPEPELVITDWWDLQVGDIIEYVDGGIKDKIGMTGPVVEFAPEATDGLFVRLECDNGPNKGRLGWPEKWRFIRRP